MKRKTAGTIILIAIFISITAVLQFIGCGKDEITTAPASPLPLEQVTFLGANFPTLSPGGQWLAYCTPHGRLLNKSLVDDQVDTLTANWEWASWPDWSKSGDLVLYVNSPFDSLSFLRTIHAFTGDTATIWSGHFIYYPRWSPKGDEIITEGLGIPGLAILSYPDAEISELQCLNPDGPCDGEMPAWSPDAQWIAYRGSPGIMKVRRTGDTARVVIEAQDVTHPAWSPNGQWIAFVMEDSGTADYHIWVSDARGADFGLWRITSTDTTCTVSPCTDIFPCWSPDSRSIYFSSNRKKTNIWEMDIWRIGFQP